MIKDNCLSEVLLLYYIHKGKMCNGIIKAKMSSHEPWTKLLLMVILHVCRSTIIWLDDVSTCTQRPLLWIPM